MCRFVPVHGLGSWPWPVSCARSCSWTPSGPRSGAPGPKGVFWRTRADDLGVKVVRELLRRNPQLDACADRRRRHGRDRAGRRPGADSRPRRRAPRRAAAVRPGLRGRPHVRWSTNGRHGRGRRDRDGLRRRRPRRRRRAHGPPPDGRRRRLQPALRRRAAGRHLGGDDGCDRREPPRPLSRADEAGRRRVRGPLAAPRGRGLGERGDARDGRPDVGLHRRRLAASRTATSSCGRTRASRGSPTCPRRSDPAAA